MAAPARVLGTPADPQLDRPSHVADVVSAEAPAGADEVGRASVPLAVGMVRQSALSMVQTYLPEYRTALERIIAKLAINENGCWIWTGKLNHSGYGSIRDRGKWVSVHRITYTLFRGEIPSGLHVDHLCRTPACCNPRHLEPVTCKENLLRGVGVNAINAAKTKCYLGHPFSGDNLRIDSRGRRRCRTCQREQQRRRRSIHGR